MPTWSSRRIKLNWDALVYKLKAKFPERNYELSLTVQNDQFRDLYMNTLNFLINQICGIRSHGPAALGLCYVACGRIDAYQCDVLYPWDPAAGTLIVHEAGGHVVDSAGKEFDLMKPNFFATSRKALSDQFMKIGMKRK